MTKQTETKTKTVLTGVKKMVHSKFHYEEHPTRLRQLRVASQCSQDKMADQVEYSHTSYGEIERGRRPVRRETAERLATLLHSKVELLFNQRDKKFVAKKV